MKLLPESLVLIAELPAEPRTRELAFTGQAHDDPCLPILEDHLGVIPSSVDLFGLIEAPGSKTFHSL